MIEVFKTNVRDAGQARRLIKLIHQHYKDYRANFDLEDCDRILRVACSKGMVQTLSLISFLNSLDLQAEALLDE